MSGAIDQLGAAESVDRDSRPAGGSADEAEGRAAGTAGADASERDTGEARRRRALVAGLTTLLALPLGISLAIQRTPRWYPSVDMAQIEMRIRDVGSSHPPLVGLGGRIFGFGQQGSHPGPISFYSMAPVYRLLGSSAWSMQAAGVVLDVVAIGLAVWIGYRRWGPQGAVGVAAGMGLLLRYYGPELVTMPWNPHFPVLWWAVVLLGVWSVLCDDLPLLAVVVVAGSLCAQTHVPYVGLVGGLLAVTAAWLVVVAVRRRGQRRRIAVWGAASAGLGLLLWLPPIVQQLANSPGNLSIIVENFGHPADEPLGLRPAWDLFLARLDPLAFVGADPARTNAPAVTLLVAWAAAVAVAAWLRHGKLLRLHAVVGAALVLAVVSISRIFGVAWAYLTYWLGGTIALTLGAVVATAVVAVGVALARAPEPAPDSGSAEDQEATAAAPVAAEPPAWVRPAVLTVLALVPALLFIADATGTDDPDPRVSAALRQLAPDTIAALGRGDVPGGGRDGTYLVTWVDPVDLGSPGFSLLLDLERHGFDVSTDDQPFNDVAVGAHRTMRADEADAEVHVSVGDADIAAWRSRPGVDQVSVYEPRSQAEQAETRRIDRQIVDRLEAEGLHDLAGTFERVRMAAAIDARMPADLAAVFDRLNAIPQPVAVFVGEVSR